LVLVTGATGNNGVELTKLLAAQGVSVRAMVRSADRATAIAGVARVEIVEGDFDDSKSVERALNGVEKAFLLTNSSERAEVQQCTFMDIARRSGLALIVKLTARRR